MNQCKFNIFFHLLLIILKYINRSKSLLVIENKISYGYLNIFISIHCSITCVIKLKRNMLIFTINIIVALLQISLPYIIVVGTLSLCTNICSRFCYFQYFMIDLKVYLAINLAFYAYRIMDHKRNKIHIPFRHTYGRDKEKLVLVDCNYKSECDIYDSRLKMKYVLVGYWHLSSNFNVFINMLIMLVHGVENDVTFLKKEVINHEITKLANLFYANFVTTLKIIEL